MLIARIKQISPAIWRSHSIRRYHTAVATVFKRGGSGSRGATYYYAYFDHRGERVTRSARTSDKATALRIAAKYEAQAALRRDGVIDPTLDQVRQESRRDIESHLVDFEAKLRAGARTADHIGRTLKFIRTICAENRWVRADEMTADGVHRHASRLLTQNKSLRTVQARLAAIKSFTRWLSVNHKLPRDPLLGIKQPNPATDRRRTRRVLLPEEWKWLVGVLESAAYSFGMSGTQRRLLYETAIQTGLRAKELRSLKVGNLYLTVSQPYLVCRAESTKNRLEAKQYLLPELAQRLAREAHDKSARASVFRLPHGTNLAKMLRGDIELARQAWLEQANEDAQELAGRQESDFLLATNAQGEVLDFHALRHTCGAWLASSGAQPKVVQVVMRHSSIVLTMDTYGHLFPGQEADAVARLATLLG
jgi:integrase